MKTKSKTFPKDSDPSDILDFIMQNIDTYEYEVREHLSMDVVVALRDKIIIKIINQSDNSNKV